MKKESKNPQEETNGNPKSKRERPIMPKVFTHARNFFSKQLDKDTNMKRRCLLEGIKLMFSDVPEGWLAVKNETKSLLDSMKFNADCAARGLNPEAVASHLVFGGSTLVNNVLKNGLENVIGDKVMMYHENLFIDEHNLFTQKENNETAETA